MRKASQRRQNERITSQRSIEFHRRTFYHCGNSKISLPLSYPKKYIFCDYPPFKWKRKKADPKQKKLYPRLEIILSTEKTGQNEDFPSKITEEERQLIIDIMDKQKDSFRKIKKNRNSFRRNRRWRRFSRRPGKRFSYSAKRNTFNRKKSGFIVRRPFGKAPIRRRNNVKKPNSSNGRKNSTKKPASPVKN